MPYESIGLMPGYDPKIYKRQPSAALTNEGAAGYQKRTGVMPKKTYGGLFGGALPNPSNVPTSQQTIDAARNNPFAPMHQAPLAMAPTTQVGYQQQMQAQNPGGSLFGGALPALNPQGKPGFFGPPQAPEANPGFDKAAFAKSHSLYFNPGTGTISGQSLEGMQPGTIRSMQTRGYGFGAHTPAAPVAEADRYGKLGLVAPGQRSGGPNVTAKQTRMLARSAAQKEQFEQGLGLASPGAYAQMKASAGQQALAKSQMDSTNAFRESDLGLRRDALKQQATLAGDREKGATDRAKLNIFAKGVDPQTGQPVNSAKKPTAADIAVMSPNDAVAAMEKANMSPAEINDAMRADARTNPSRYGRVATDPTHNFVDNPSGHPSLFQAPFSLAERAVSGIGSLFGNRGTKPGGYYAPGAKERLEKMRKTSAAKR